MSRRITSALLLTATVALVMPAAAQAAKRTVFMGVPPANQKAFQALKSDVNAFFPNTVRIRKGDTVAFTPVGFHSVDLPPRGGRPLPLITATGKKVAGVADEAGAPFWFNGLDELGFNRLLQQSRFGKTIRLTPQRLRSGLPLADKPKPMNVRFPRAGLFRYYCNVHPRMRGSVRVVGKDRRADSARSIAKRVRTQAATALAEARRVPAATKPPANTVSVGAEGRNGVTYFDFVPKTVTVPVGTSMLFAMPARSTEDHTATTGPGDPAKEPNSYLGALAGSFQRPAFDPRATYPSEQPPAIGALSPALHGNGFWNSGVMDTIAGSPPPPANAVTFAAAGKYRFFCLIHPFMSATVTVQ